MDLRVKWLFFRFREGSTAVGEPLPESLLRKSPKKSKLGKSESVTDPQESAEKSRYLPFRFSYYLCGVGCGADRRSAPQEGYE